MQNTIQKNQRMAAEQAEMLLNLLRISFEGNQEMLEFNATMAKRSLNLVAKHSKALITNQQLAQNPVWLVELAQDANQACSDYLLGSKALINAMQNQINSLIKSQAEQFGEALTQSIAELKPIPAGQEIIDLTVRSWTGATQKGFEQAREWQKQIEVSGEGGSKLIAALTAQAARNQGGNTRRVAATA